MVLELYISICLFLLGAQKSRFAVERAPKNTPKHDLKIPKNRVWPMLPPHRNNSKRDAGSSKLEVPNHFKTQFLNPTRIQSETLPSPKPTSEMSSTTLFLNPKHIQSETLPSPKLRSEMSSATPYMNLAAVMTSAECLKAYLCAR